MTDSLKLAEMQRTNIEFERQRHLANWFIKSSPHMPTPSLDPNGGNSGGGGGGICSGLSLIGAIPIGGPPLVRNSNSNSKLHLQQSQQSYPSQSVAQQQQTQSYQKSSTKNGTITTTNPLFFLMSAGQKPPPPPPPTQFPVNASSSALASRSQQLFTSQTNLPLQIVTTSAQEGHKPKLRRFNSHDTSANMFSVADFENARLVRRNEIEMKQRQQQQRLKMNSLSSGGDCSTGDSKGSKYSNDSQPEPLAAETFLERYPPPRVAYVSYKPKFSNETLQSSSSNGSSSTNSLTSTTNKTQADASKPNGELYLIYRYLRQRKIYHAYNSKSGPSSRKKGVMIPQEFPGYFTLLNDKGAPTATLYTTLVQLVRERVYKFISVDNLPAFTESRTTDTFPPRSHYVKSTARSGQVFRLLAVFEDGKHDSSTTSASKNLSSSGREKEKGRYAQLLNENRQILYVSLTTKGKFYEIEPGVPQILQKTGMVKEAQRKLNPDCVHRISSLLKSDVEYPVNIRYIAGPTNTINKMPENLTVSSVSLENVLIACPIEDVEARSELHLKKLLVTGDMTLMKCFLGFENEQRMFSNQNVQNILKFCQFDCDGFMKQVEMETLTRPERTSSKSRVDGLKILKPLNLPKLLRREKTTIAHEKEDSIIFLSKNDLANLESRAEENRNNQEARISDRMKVFQPSKKKWFRRSEKTTSLSSLNLDEQAKRMSMERYNDMSKLLQERFGDALNETLSERPTSDLGLSVKPRTQIQKSLSLQEVDFIDKPDLVPENYSERNIDGSQLELAGDDQSTVETDLTQSHAPQQSFISQKLYSEFHVKTRQYSKSSSSLHQLLHFAVPHRMNIVETKKQPGKSAPKSASGQSGSRKFEFDLGEKIDTANLRFPTALTTNPIIDDLPYSSVRDSLLPDDNLLDDDVNDTDSGVDDTNGGGGGGRNGSGSDSVPKRRSMGDFVANAKENIYAEICNDGGAVSRIQITCCYGGGSGGGSQQSSEVLTTLSSASGGSGSAGGYTDLPMTQMTMSAIQSHDNDGASAQNIYNTIK